MEGDNIGLTDMERQS